jgi:hypothetical protein
MVRSLDTLPDGYSVDHQPGVGFVPRDPAGVPLSPPAPTYEDAIAIACMHWEAELALGARPRLRPPPPVTDGSEALVAGNVGVTGRGPFTETPSPRPGAVYSPQVDARAVIAGEAAADEQS